jgi:hypothetical protein
MLDANKYIDRLRVIVKEEQHDRIKFVSRVEDLIKDYDREFNSFLNEMETLGRQGKSGDIVLLKEEDKERKKNVETN